MKTISPKSDMANVKARSVLLGWNSGSVVSVPSTRDSASRNGMIKEFIRSVGTMP